jgi:hypothetical protein
MKLYCPSCGASLIAPDGWSGRAACAKCGHRWEYKPPPAARSPVTIPAPTAPPPVPNLDPIVFDCCDREPVANTRPSDFELVSVDHSPPPSHARDAPPQSDEPSYQDEGSVPLKRHELRLPKADRPYWRTVQVSARLLSWPRRCVCCGGQANTSYSASYTRTTGKRVIRHDTRSWDVPYCDDCLEHVKKRKAGDSALVGGVVALVIAVLACFHPDIMVAGKVFIFLCGGGALVGGISLQRSWYLQGDEFAKDTCASLGKHAIQYHGWNGSVHTFEFANEDYHDAFCEANRKKLLG